jgi:hypothetical protein
MIDNSTGDVTNKRWKYTWHKTRKIKSGYYTGLGPSDDTWDTVVGAIAGPSSTWGYAYNGMENINYASGTSYGNGWTQAAIDAINAANTLGNTWAARPILVNTVFWAQVVYPEDGGLPEMWFSAANAVRPGA